VLQIPSQHPEWLAWRKDVNRYERGHRLRQPALWAILVYRFGRFAASRRGLERLVLMGIYGAVHLPIELLTGISIPRRTEIGEGFRIDHFGGVVIHPESRVGRNCTFLHGVTLGIREDGHAPVIEDDVVLGAYAQVLGRVTVGRGAKVGAMSVVIHDVPSGAAVAGAPARVVGRHRFFETAPGDVDRQEAGS
jgi:serine O-acetyltransferase